ncbi:MAG: hypothetical protein ACREJ2_16690 [Planctomycetota bacterium]
MTPQPRTRHESSPEKPVFSNPSFALHSIQVASPCTADWEAMRGDAQARHCDHCDKQVFNLSEMTEADALELLREYQGHLCVRFYRRADGTILTQDCSVGAAEQRRAKLHAAWARTAATVAAAGVFALGAFGAGCASATSTEPAADPPVKAAATAQPAPRQTPALIGAPEPTPAPVANPKPTPLTPVTLQPTPPEKRLEMGDVVRLAPVPVANPTPTSPAPVKVQPVPPQPRVVMGAMQAVAMPVANPQPAPPAPVKTKSAAPTGQWETGGACPAQ